MNIITISREFGSGGRELGKRLADFLKYDYYDSEIIYTIAKKSGLDANYIENMFDNFELKDYTFSLRNTFNSPIYFQNLQIDLLVLQKKVIEEIAALGKNCIIVGRNADIILNDYNPFKIFVCAKKDAKLKRCMERTKDGEKFSEKELLKKMERIDHIRANTRVLLNGSVWGQRDAYNMIINTTDWEIKNIIPSVASFAQNWFEMNKGNIE